MNSPWDDERLSAYLDGQLAPEEVRAVEQMLAEDDRARQALDELRALRKTLRALPRHTLDARFSDGVLRHAERAMLAPSVRTAVRDDDTTSDATSDEPGRGDADATRPASKTSPRSLRPLLWAGLAVAAAIVLLVVNRTPPPDDRPLAEGPRRENERAAVSAIDEEFSDERQPARENVPAFAPAGEENRASKMDSDASPRGALGHAETLRESKVGEGRRMMALATDMDPDGALIVQVDLSPDAASNGEFDKLLARNAIDLEVQEEDRAADVLDVGQYRKVVDRVGKITDANPRGQASAKEAEAVETWDVIYVEARATQMADTLADLNAQPHQFLNVAIDPSPGDPVQQPLLAYQRGDRKFQKNAAGYGGGGGGGFKEGLRADDGYSQRAETAKTEYPLDIPARAKRMRFQVGRAGGAAGHDAFPLTTSADAQKADRNESAASPPPAEPSGPSQAGDPAEADQGAEAARQLAKVQNRSTADPVRAFFLLRVVNPPAAPAAKANE